MRLLDPPGTPGEARMSLFDHLSELRSRLIRCVIAVLVLGSVSLVFAKPIFGLLMKPVLDALPPESRTLIYTSGIEELNVLMRVGMYSGIFLTTPIILWQLWGFVSPGLYPSERKFAAPFVLLGSLAFIGGTAFCYFVMLPTMFQFLLNDADVTALEARLTTAQRQEQDALRYLRLGEADHAGAIAKAAAADLRAEGEGKLDARQAVPNARLDAAVRLEAMGRLVDAASLGFGASARPVLRQVMEHRAAASDALAKGDVLGANRALDETAATFAGIEPSSATELNELWKLEKDLSVGKGRYDAQRWTRPMLSMHEQLGLVLLLELAFGIIFELPLVMALLAQLGLIKASWLMKYQRHAFVVCLIVAAVITPTGDAVNLALMAGPMLACYELGVLAAWLIERRRNKAAGSTAITPAP